VLTRSFDQQNKGQELNITKIFLF